MSSRLDKLFGLLTTGSSVAREHAAVRFAELAISGFAGDVFLNKLFDAVTNASWDTRIAAAKALQIIAAKWTDITNEFNENNTLSLNSELFFNTNTMTRFSLSSSINDFQHLLANEDVDFDRAGSSVGQRRSTEDGRVDEYKEIDKQLGLNSDLLGLSSREWISEEDVKGCDFYQDNLESKPKKLRYCVDSEFCLPLCFATDEDKERIRQKLMCWSFGSFFTRLLQETLVDANWCKRHGASLALKELLRTFGFFLKLNGHACPTEPAKQLKDDIVLLIVLKQLLFVAARDRFNDFVGSQVIAPVRESLAQMFGLVCSFLWPASVEAVADKWLKQFTDFDSWECVYFAVLCLKYTLPVLAQSSSSTQVCAAALSDIKKKESSTASASNLFRNILNRFLPAMATHLVSANEDICAALSQTLLSIADDMISLKEQLTSEPFHRILESCVQILVPAPSRAVGSESGSRPGSVPASDSLSGDGELVTDKNELVLQCVMVIVAKFMPLILQQDSGDGVVGSSKTKQHQDLFGRLCCFNGLATVLAYLDHCSTDVKLAAANCALVLVEYIEKTENGFDWLLDETEAKTTGTFQTSFSGSDPLAQNSCFNSSPARSVLVARIQAMLQFLMQHILLDSGVIQLEQLWPAVVSCLLKSVGDGVFADAVCPLIGIWLSHLMVPDTAPRIELRHVLAFCDVRHFSQGRASLESSATMVIGGAEYLSLSTDDSQREELVSAVKQRVATLMVPVFAIVSRCFEPLQEHLECPARSLFSLFAFHLASNCYAQRSAVAMAVENWGRSDSQSLKCWIRALGEGGEGPHDCSPQEGGVPPTEGGGAPMGVAKAESLVALLFEALQHEPPIYDEVAYKFSELNSICRQFVAALRQFGVVSANAYATSTPFLLAEANELCKSTAATLTTVPQLQKKQKLEEKRDAVKNCVSQLQATVTRLSARLSMLLSAAILVCDYLPLKINPVVRPLTDSLKTETNKVLVDVAARALTKLLSLAESRVPCPNDKIVANLCAFHCAERLEVISQQNTSDGGQGQLGSCSTVERASNSGTPTTPLLGTPVTPSVALDVCSPQTLNTGKALQQMLRCFGERSAQLFPGFWQKLKCEGVLITTLPSANDNSLENLISGLQLIESLFAHIPASLQRSLIELLNNSCNNDNENKQQRLPLDLFTSALCDERPLLRVCVTRALIACFRSERLIETVNAVLPKCLQLLATAKNQQDQQLNQSSATKLGVLELFNTLTVQLDVRLVGIITLLSVPLISYMSDPCPAVRRLAAMTFALLVKFMPLETEHQVPADLSPNLQQLWKQESCFLTGLMHPETLDQFKDLPFSLRSGVSLRQYQLEGISWLRFLRHYGLHGILCDDMGLGKTLQTLCVLAVAHHASLGGAAAPENNTRPSLIVCPTTLVNHWQQEIDRYFGGTEQMILRATIVQSKQALDERALSRGECNIVVASYDTVRREDVFQKVLWHYCVLDEGHIIKNPKTQLFRALLAICADHRLILSGTPIQNSVMELWSLFEFLMPGYFGNYQYFNSNFAKPILSSRDAKASSREAEQGQKALELLHKQVLPFVLRRQKSDVLRDLPPKIIQDYTCNLTPLQSLLYEQFSDGLSRQKNEAGAAANLSKQTAFQVLNYLRKLCDHPALVLDEKHPKFGEVSEQLRQSGTSLKSPQNSGKLIAFAQLLLECGIGCGDFAMTTHRALVFCQFKSMVELIAQTIDSGALQQLMLSEEFGGGCDREVSQISYLRLDGTVPPNQRQAVAAAFNGDPSIDILLLTTQIGGLGLNLTGADVVIFIDHDWNPVRDMQAMDRAHRLGQKSTVNVYRLITRGTLEEKIMHLQNFKKHVASTVINEDNRDFLSLGSSQLLDLLSLDKGGEIKKKSSKAPPLSAQTHAINMNLEELWDNSSQYDEAFDVGSFLSTLRS